MRRRDWEREWVRPTAETLCTELALVSVLLSETTVRGWSDKEVQDAEWWAAHEHLSASDNPVRRYPQPPHVPNPAGCSDALNDEDYASAERAGEP